MNELLLKGDIRILQSLIPNVNLSSRDKQGNIPLHYLVKNKDPAALELVRGRKLDANAASHIGWTPRDVAVRRAYFEKVKFLLERGAKPNNIDNDGDVAVRYLLYDLSDSEEARRVFELLLLYGADPHILSRHKYTSIALDLAMDNLDFAKVLLAHLAKMDSFGVPLNEFFDKKIKSNATLEDYYDTCKRQIEKMKVTTVFGYVTLFKLLGASQKTLIMYARNEEFLLKYESVKNNEYNVHPYYVKLLQFRVEKAIAIAKMKNEAVYVICQSIGLPTSMIGTVVENIVNHLNQNDLKILLKSKMCKNS